MTSLVYETACVYKHINVSGKFGIRVHPQRFSLGNIEMKAKLFNR